MALDIEIPYGWSARPHQSPFMQYMLKDGGGKRACMVWHRRAGKDSASINFTAAQAHQKIATYWHMLPTQTHARKVVWENINPHTGVRVIDQAFPPQIRQSINNTDMKIELKCGSIWQCVGSDNYDSLIGSAPFGVIFSEYSVADPAAWDYIRPMLKENGGWAIFIYTPRGKNHGHKLYETAKKSPRWFCELLTVDDTFREDGEPIFSAQDIAEEEEDGMDPMKIQQEYYCSFDAGMVGAYFTTQMNQLDTEGRLGEYPHMEDRPVQTYWDLGWSDDNYIIFTQQDGEYTRIIDIEKGNNKSLSEWLKIVSEKPYLYNRHVGPHDLNQHDYTIGITRKEFARRLGFHFDIVAKSSEVEGIDASRRFLKKVKINEVNCGHLYDCMTSYRREFDEKNKVFRQKPLHDWASHGAKAFQYMAQGHREHGGVLDHLVLGNHHKARVITAVGGKRKNASANNMFPI